MKTQKAVLVLPEHVACPQVFGEALAKWLEKGWLVHSLTLFGPQGGILILEHNHEPTRLNQTNL